MLRMLTYFVIGLFLIACTPLGAGKSEILSPKITSRPGWTVYTETRLNIVFQLPAKWQRIERNGAPHEFEDQDGYGYASFSDSLISPTNSGESVEALCQKEVELANAKHQEFGQKPYGEHPKVIKAQIDQQPACFVLPSTDQDEHFEGKSVLFVRYPPALALKPEQLRFLNVVSDKDHIQSIAETIHFVLSETEQSIEPLSQASPFTPIRLGNLKLEDQRVISMALDETDLYWTVYEQPGVIFRTSLKRGAIEKFVATGFEDGEVVMMPPIREGDWLIYLDISSKDKKWELHAKNLQDESNTVVMVGSGDPTFPLVPFVSADGSRVAWTHTTNNTERPCVESILGLSDLATGDHVEIDRACIDQYMWSIVGLSNRYLVAEQDLPDAKGGGNNLYLFDLNNGHREVLAKDGRNSMPRISYPWIIWKNAPRFNWGYSNSIYDLRDGKHRTVLVPGESPPDPNLEGQWLYWVIKSNTKNEESSIYLYDLERDKTWMVTAPEKDVFSAVAINNNTIAWSRRSDFTAFGDSVLEWGILP